MNIEEAKKKVEKYSVYPQDTKNNVIDIKTILDILDQIELDQPKPVVPQFVADWVEDHKQSFADSSAIDMYENLAYDNSHGYHHDVWLWAIDHHNDFINAWTYGYIVKKDKLYTVEIPNPNGLFSTKQKDVHTERPLVKFKLK
ncbi:DUF1642 domain-containing protein [Streptococcus pyogenes]|uniref:DUF1642 domain-containing protein n=1 Tax=Streptococcus pyogenes TaxID=1314 RepID=UPI00109BFC8C|nr:DUF1642 domain-containing protein [Streptococcus pyogenes]VHE29971.1 phage protein [Streptococcus pyogenes]